MDLISLHLPTTIWLMPKRHQYIRGDMCLSSAGKQLLGRWTKEEYSRVAFQLHYQVRGTKDIIIIIVIITIVIIIMEGFQVVQHIPLPPCCRSSVLWYVRMVDAI